MSSATPTSSFQPIPESVYRPPPESSYEEQHRQIYRELEVLNMATRYGETPYTWGWAILRAVYTPESDVIFPGAVDKLNRWLVYYVKLKQPMYPNGSERPQPTDELVKRLHNIVFEDCEQLENASWDAVYDYFESWVKEQEKGNPSRRHIQALGFDPDRYIFRGVPGIVRYNSCIVLDEAALTAISSLPGVPPNTSQHERGGASGGTVD